MSKQNFKLVLLLSITPYSFESSYDANTCIAHRYAICNCQYFSEIQHASTASNLQLLLLDSIPPICHFFYTGQIFLKQYFTPKNYEKHPKITTNSPKKCKIYSFCIQSEIFYTGQIFFTQAPPVVPVTNMRYARF